MNVCEHAEKAESYPGRWVLSHSSLVKKVTFGSVDLACFARWIVCYLVSILGAMTWSTFVDIAPWPGGEQENVT